MVAQVNSSVERLDLSMADALESLLGAVMPAGTVLYAVTPGFRQKEVQTKGHPDRRTSILFVPGV